MHIEIFPFAASALPLVCAWTGRPARQSGNTSASAFFMFGCGVAAQKFRANSIRSARPRRLFCRTFARQAPIEPLRDRSGDPTPGFDGLHSGFFVAVDDHSGFDE